MERTKTALLTILTLCFSFQAFAQYTEKDIYSYIDNYKELAINKMYEYKIPASITIAQGIFESACGTSRLATEGNNHFGIKCHKDWTGDTLLIDDDELQECFRKYEKPEDSYNDHSLFLKNRPRYSSLFELDVMDYKGWAHGLKAAGYATNPEYAPRLIRIIETYHIAQLDTIYQQRLEAGYFKDYPNVHPELAAVAATAQPQTVETNDKGNVENPANSQVESKKPILNKKPRTQKITKKPVPASKPVPATNPETTPAPQPQATITVAVEPAPMASEPEKKNEVIESFDENAATEMAEKEEKPTAITVFSATDGDFPLAEYPFTDRKVYVNNNTFFVIAEKGDTYAKIARAVQDKDKRLKKFNDVSGSSKLKVGQVVYIERKANTGKTEYYTVVNAESLVYISQKEAVSLKKLCKYNNITPTEKLKKGRVIKLKK